MPEQPDWIEIGNAEFDCGKCGHRLDRVFWYPDTDHEGAWLACPNCGWDDAPPETAINDVVWYQNRYGG